MRAQIRNSNFKSGGEVVYWKSLQTCTVSNNMTFIKNHIKSIKSPLGPLKAMKAILEILLAVLPGDDEIMRRKTIVPVDFGYELFLSYGNHANPESLIYNMEYKNNFKTLSLP